MRGLCTQCVCEDQRRARRHCLGGAQVALEPARRVAAAVAGQEKG